MAKSGISVQELIDKFQLSTHQLEKELSEEHLREVSRIIDDDEILGPELGLSTADMTAISSDAKKKEHQRMEMLRKWKQIFAFKATYWKLIEAFLNCKRADCAQNVCQFLTKCKYYTAWTSGCRHAVANVLFLVIAGMSPEQPIASASQSDTSYLTVHDAASTQAREHGTSTLS